MAAGSYDFEFEQGVPCVKVIAVEGLSLTGLSARMQIRERLGGPVLITPTCTVLSQEITVTITATQSAAVPVACLGQYERYPLIYDLEVYAGAETDQLPLRLLQGVATLIPEVTK